MILFDGYFIINILFFQKIAPNTQIFNVYGMTELTGIAFTLEESLTDTSGKPSPHLDYRVSNIDNIVVYTYSSVYIKVF